MRKLRVRAKLIVDFDQEVGQLHAAHLFCQPGFEAGQRLEEFFIDDLRWQGIREDFFRRSGLPADTKRVPEYLARRLARSL